MTTQPVNCPCCGRLLSGDLKHDNQVMAFRQTNPKLGWVKGAPFKVCPHCKVVVALKPGDGGLLAVAASPVYASSRPAPLA